MPRNAWVIAAIIGFFTGAIFGGVQLFALGESGVLERPEVEYKAAGLRDPFVNILKKEELSKANESAGEEIPPPKLDIQGVIWGDGPSRAIINNKVVSAGDNIEGAKVIKISKDGIIILYSGREYSFSSPAKSNLKDAQKQLTGGAYEE